jgi:hypothetical protein
MFNLINANFRTSLDGSHSITRMISFVIWSFSVSVGSCKRDNVERELIRTEGRRSRRRSRIAVAMISKMYPSIWSGRAVTMEESNEQERALIFPVPLFNAFDSVQM